MSTLKKVISLVLCVAILAGSFVLVGNIAPVASAADDEPKSKVQSYADLVAQYGQNGDGFVYTGLEFYESNGKLTDYYVKSGDELTARVYIKSNLWVGESYILTLYDNKFFDIKLAGGPGATTVATGYTSNYQDAPINPNHPIVLANNSGHTLTTINLTNVGWIKNLCGFSTTYLSETDLAQSNTATDITVSTEAYDMTQDIWLFEYYVKIKDGLTDGTKGIVTSPETLWHSSMNGKKHDARKKAYIAAVKPADYAAGKTKLTNTTTMALCMDGGIIDHFVKDHEHEFIIGEPVTTEPVTMTASFYAEDESLIKTDKVEVGQPVEFPAAVEGQLGWALVKEGMTTPGTLLTEDTYTAKDADATFLRVLSTSEFPVDIALDAKADEIVADAAKLAEAGVEYIADKATLRVMLAIGEKFDLAAITEEAITKKGHAFKGWEVKATAPSTADGTAITLNTINGVLGSTVTLSAKATWEAETYTVNFYVEKGAAEPENSVEVAYNGKTSYGAIQTAKTDKKFAGWYNAANDEFISDLAAYVFTVTDDLNVYAAWSDYKNVATFMARDYATGNWVKVDTVIDYSEGETATVAKDRVERILKNVCADSSITFRNIYTTNPDEITDGNYEGSTIPGIIQLGAGVYMTAPIDYSGNKTFYVATVSACEVTWKTPAYDEATNTFDEANATVISVEKVSTAAYASDDADPYKAVSKLTKEVKAPAGYALAGWKDAATGEKVELNANGAYEIDAATKTATLIAEFELVEYTIKFNLRNAATEDIIIKTDKVTLGEEITLDGEYTFNGEATVLPEIGKEPGDVKYTIPAGYDFAGWTFGYGSSAVNAEFPTKLTATLIKQSAVNDAITLSAKWEAREFNLTFYITNAEGEEELFATHKVKAGADIASYRNVTAEMAAAINAKAPEGQKFSNIWYNKETGTTDTTTKMPAKDVAYYAAYSVATIKVYVDYAFLADKDLNQTMDVFKIDGREILSYGEDITTVKEEAPYYSRSFETVVMRAPITLRPTDPSEVIGWNIYHVAAGEDPYTAEWKPGVNDEGTTIATTTLIFQPIWLAHKDMLFRIYDTDGNIAHALGKNLKTYFWNNGEIVESSKDTAINRNTELYLGYLLTMSIENWNWDEFFNIEMWQNITVRFDPFGIPKSWFTWEGFKGLMDAIGNALGSLL